MLGACHPSGVRGQAGARIRAGGWRSRSTVPRPGWRCRKARSYLVRALSILLIESVPRCRGISITQATASVVPFLAVMSCQYDLAEPPRARWTKVRSRWRECRRPFGKADARIRHGRAMRQPWRPTSSDPAPRLRHPGREHARGRAMWLQCAMQAASVARAV